MNQCSTITSSKKNGLPPMKPDLTANPEKFTLSKIYHSKRDFLEYARRQATYNQYELSTVVFHTKRVGIAMFTSMQRKTIERDGRTDIACSHE